MKICKGCKVELLEDAVVCSACGRKVSSVNSGKISGIILLSAVVMIGFLLIRNPNSNDSEVESVDQEDNSELTEFDLMVEASNGSFDFINQNNHINRFNRNWGAPMYVTNDFVYLARRPNYNGVPLTFYVFTHELELYNILELPQWVDTIAIRDYGIYSSYNGHLYRYDRATSELEQLVPEIDNIHHKILVDRFVFYLDYRYGSIDYRNLNVLDLETGEVMRLVDGATSAL